MNAAELRVLGERLKKIVPADLEAAAEIIDLLAWAEENKVDVQRGQYFWWSRNLEGGDAGQKTLVELLRRAREESK